MPDDHREALIATAKAAASAMSLLATALPRSHAAYVMVATAMLDHELERSIKKKLRPLNAKMSKRLFRGYGPLSTFSSRVDMAFALGITTPEIHRELNKIRAIRNLFAHSTDLLRLDKEPVKPIFDSPICRPKF